MNVSIKDRAKELAAALLDGRTVKQSEWQALAAEQLQAEAVETVKAERARQARENELRTAYQQLSERVRAAKSVIAGVTALSAELDERERLRVIRERAGQGDTDFELALLRERNADSEERFLGGKRYEAARDEIEAARDALDALRKTAAAEGIAL